MNPLCCIAPVSIDRDQSNPVIAKSVTQPPLGFESSVRNVGFGSNKQSFSTQVSSVGTDLDSGVSVAANHESEEKVAEGKDSKGCCSNGVVNGSVAGILYKWVNYGKGWRSRWFVLEDGVLSYYKVHGPDKISVSSVRDKSVKVIGEDSLRYMRKANWGNGLRGSSMKPWKPVGEIHLKVCPLFFKFS